MSSTNNLANLACPSCKSELKDVKGALVCNSCKHKYTVKDNIPLMCETDTETTRPTKLAYNPFKYSIDTRMREVNMIPLLKPSSSDKILDVGCGLGYYTGLLSESGAEVTGVDLDFSSLLFGKENTSADYVAGAADNLPFKDSSFNKVLFSNVIEHIEDDNKAVSEIARVSKNGAKVIISTAALEGLLPPTDLCHKEGTEIHIKEGYSAKELATIMEANSIKVERVVYTVGLFTKVFMELIKLTYTIHNRVTKKQFKRQTDIAGIEKSPIFHMLRIVFPLVLLVGKIEDKLLNPLLKGHCVIVLGTVQK